MTESVTLPTHNHTRQFTSTIIFCVIFFCMSPHHIKSLTNTKQLQIMILEIVQMTNKLFQHASHEQVQLQAVRATHPLLERVE